MLANATGVFIGWAAGYALVALRRRHG